MAQSIIGRMFTPSHDKGGRQRQEKIQRANEAGPPGVLGTLSFNRRADPWTVEKERRQQQVIQQYFRDKKSVTKQRQSARRDLKRRIKRKKEAIERYYDLSSLKSNDPSRKGALKRAKDKFRLESGKMERKHRRNWQRQLRKLQINRIKHKRKITRDMKNEYRKSRGRGGGSGMPWNLAA